MKKLILTSLIALLIGAWNLGRTNEWPDEYLGLPGDNLNLYAVMKLFQESETLEGFEKSLNDQNSRINNLDLNGDNLVDYIMVFDYVEGNVHTIVLRVALNEYEKQDVAVFTVEQFNDGSVQVQLIGDEALYGEDYIVEPIYADNYNETPNPGYIGRSRNRSNVVVIRTTRYEVASWPLIRFIFLPSYVVWRSHWYWGYRPHYWHPWRPYYWHYYYGYHSHWYPYYYRHYRHWNHYRYARYHDFYYRGIRSHSPKIRTRINRGLYRDTYSRPDLRRNGEALFARTNSSQNYRERGNAYSTQDNRAVSSSRRSSAVRGTTSGVDRRRYSSVNNRINTSPATVKKSNSGTSRRSSTSVSNRNETRQPSVKRPGTSSKSTTIRNSGTNRRSPALQKTETSGRPSTVRNSRTDKTSATVSKSGNLRRPATLINKRSTTRQSAVINSGNSRKPTPIGNSGNYSRRSDNNASRISRNPGTTINRKPSTTVKRNSGISDRSRSSFTIKNSSRPSYGRTNVTSRRSAPRSSAGISNKSSSIQRSSGNRSSRHSSPAGRPSVSSRRSGSSRR
jgi:hypothetical protein